MSPIHTLTEYTKEQKFLKSKKSSKCWFTMLMFSFLLIPLCFLPSADVVDFDQCNTSWQFVNRFLRSKIILSYKLMELDCAEAKNK